MFNIKFFTLEGEGVQERKPEKIALDTMINSQFANTKYITLDKTSISSVSGKKVEIQVQVTNFLNKSTTTKILVNFLTTNNNNNIY